MPKENLGRNGLSAKANTNAEGSLDTSTDPVDAEAIAQENTDSERDDGNPTTEAATQRPNEAE